MVGLTLAGTVAMTTRVSSTLTTTPEWLESPRAASSRGTSVTRRTATVPRRKRALSGEDQEAAGAAPAGGGGGSAARAAGAASVSAPPFFVVAVGCLPSCFC